MPDADEGFADNVAGHFGTALHAFGEDDGDFDDVESLPPDFVRHFDLEAVAVGADLVEVDGFEGAPAKTFVAAGRVGEGHAGDDAHVVGRGLAQHQALQAAS